MLNEALTEKFFFHADLLLSLLHFCVFVSYSYSIKLDQSLIALSKQIGILLILK